MSARRLSAAVFTLSIVAAGFTPSNVGAGFGACEENLPTPNLLTSEPTPNSQDVGSWTCVSRSHPNAQALFSPPVFAQGRAAGPPQAPQTPRAGAPVDLTGTWVSVVTEDWRWRMVTPPKGDIASVPLNPEGRKVAEGWDPTTDGSCRAYGAAAVMRMPGRIRISWDNDATLKVETDAGQQTRIFTFDATRRAGAPSLQGHSIASWERPPAGRGGPVPVTWAPLKVVTRSLTPGWLRRNGVPYSANATVTEYYLFHTDPGAGVRLTITTIVEDPTYLAQPFITSSDFKKEPDNSKWEPIPCKG